MHTITAMTLNEYQHASPHAWPNVNTDWHRRAPRAWRSSPPPSDPGCMYIHLSSSATRARERAGHAPTPRRRRRSRESSHATSARREREPARTGPFTPRLRVVLAVRSRSHPQHTGSSLILIPGNESHRGNGRDGRTNLLFLLGLTRHIPLRARHCDRTFHPLSPIISSHHTHAPPSTRLQNGRGPHQSGQ